MFEGRFTRRNAQHFALPFQQIAFQPTIIYNIELVLITAFGQSNKHLCGLQLGWQTLTRRAGFIFGLKIKQ